MFWMHHHQLLQQHWPLGSTLLLSLRSGLLFETSRWVDELMLIRGLVAVNNLEKRKPPVKAAFKIQVSGKGSRSLWWTFVRRSDKFKANLEPILVFLFLRVLCVFRTGLGSLSRAARSLSVFAVSSARLWRAAGCCWFAVSAFVSRIFRWAASSSIFTFFVISFGRCGCIGCFICIASEIHTFGRRTRIFRLGNLRSRGFWSGIGICLRIYCKSKKCENAENQYFFHAIVWLVGLTILVGGLR